MDDKIIVTNRSALVKKYGGAGLTKIRKAIEALIAADKKRGLKTRVVFLDDKADMKKLRGKPVATASDPRENKAAIDAVYKQLKPDYLMILGAPDVVPHQDMSNPMFSADDDDNPVWADLPYACSAPYSRDPSRFVGPTRVVGRLPDLVGAKTPSYLIGLLKTATTYTQRSADEYSKYFGLSAKEWSGSTKLSLYNVFGESKNLLLSPKSGPKFAKGELSARMHFINCHGGLASPEFTGQQGRRYPLSLTTKTTAGRIAEGTVAAVECCYGAELYDAITLAIDKPICQSYLDQKTYCYVGSTTIAYGPSEGNGAADLICQYFLLNILDGASAGRAMLSARQQFVDINAQMDPVDLKTLSQFYLLGDPSLHPVKASKVTGTPKGMIAADSERFSRAERRQKLQLTGDFLLKTKATACKPASKSVIAPVVKEALANIAKQAGLGAGRNFTAFGVKSPKGSTAKGTKAANMPSRYYLTVGCTSKERSPTYRRGIAIVAKESNGRIVGYRIYHQR